MKVAWKLLVVLALGAFLWFLPQLALGTSVKWLAGLSAYVLVCLLLQSVPLWLHLLAGWVLVVATLYQVCFVVPMSEKTLGESYLIFYYHFPSAISCLLLFLIAGVVSVCQLVTASPRLDTRAVSAIEVGLLACTITLATGMTWAEAAWGRIWVFHDKRLLTVAVMWFTFIAYLMFRMAVENPVKRARFSSVLAILFALNVPLVWFAIRWFGEVSHPMELKLEGENLILMGFAQWLGAASFFILYHAFWRMRYLASLMESDCERLEESFGMEKI